jgi:hypothetical protein
LWTAEGNILWDCISLIDDATVTLVNGLGGVCAIAAAGTSPVERCCIGQRELGAKAGVLGGHCLREPGP